jgi:hypothetical protein
MLRREIMDREQVLRRRIKALTWLFIIGLALSGATAIPLLSELDRLVQLTGASQLVETPSSTGVPGWALWLTWVQRALREADAHWPFIFYGTDWLAFGHFAIALAFVGALRDPIRNRWLFTFGLMACALVIPYALVFGAVRGIPFWWRLIDCLFGVFGIVPLWFCRRWVDELQSPRQQP